MNFPKLCPRLCRRGAVVETDGIYKVGFTDDPSAKVAEATMFLADDCTKLEFLFAAAPYLYDAAEGLLADYRIPDDNPYKIALIDALEKARGNLAKWKVP